MRRRRLLGLLCALGAGCTSVPPTPSLDGRWLPVAATLDGAPMAVALFNGAVLELENGSYAFGFDHGTYAQVEGGPPARLDVEGREGPNAGRRLPAIYRIDGDVLVICYQIGGGPRPAAFASLPGTRTLLVTYRRA